MERGTKGEMKQRTIHNEEQRQKASQALLGIKPPFVVTVTEGTKIRTEGQNSRYWADMEFLLEQIDEAVERLSDEFGYTNIEVRREIAKGMLNEYQPECSAILFVRNKEAAHEVIKMICNIPTSTRLGTKAFQKFDGVRERVMAELLGAINATIRGEQP